MFRPTSPQRPLFGVENRVTPVKRERLEQTWAHAYRTEALPLIDEMRFKKYFDPDNGRPNKSIRLVVSVLVLKEVFDYTDRECLEALEWNTLWHYALDILPEDAHTCQKTLHNYRARLLGDDQGAGLFESTTAALIKAAGIRTGWQRQDSTHVVSNIKVLTRLGLFVRTITAFLEDLRRKYPGLAAKVTDELCERYLDREGYFADARGSEAPRRLETAAVDANWLIVSFSGHRKVSAMNSFLLVKRLFEEQCVPPETATPDSVELQERPSSDSLQSPSDPDVTYGYKGKGYEAQIAETCEPENPFQVVTAVNVTGANESDQQQVVPVLEQVERTCGTAPVVMMADAGFASGENIVAARERGTDLRAPIGSKGPDKKTVTSGDFEFDVTGEKVVRCPIGEVPVAHKAKVPGKVYLAVFTAEQCAPCPLRGQCPTRRKGNIRTLLFRTTEAAVVERRREQVTPTFKESYKLRSGIEATNSELKRCHGFAKLPVRRRPRVELAVRLKVLALNLKRLVTNLVGMASASAPVPNCAC